MAVTSSDIKEAFYLFDEDLKGWVSSENMVYVLQAIGFGDLSEQEVQALIKSMDSDGSGRIEFHEYEKTILRKRVEAGSSEEILNAFKLFDEKNAGKITKADLEAVNKRNGMGLTPDQIDRIVAVGFNPETKELLYDGWRLQMNGLEAIGNRRATKV